MTQQAARRPVGRRSPRLHSHQRPSPITTRPHCGSRGALSWGRRGRPVGTSPRMLTIHPTSALHTHPLPVSPATSPTGHATLVAAAACSRARHGGTLTGSRRERPLRRPCPPCSAGQVGRGAWPAAAPPLLSFSAGRRPKQAPHRPGQQRLAQRTALNSADSRVPTARSFLIFRRTRRSRPAKAPGVSPVAP